MRRFRLFLAVALCLILAMPAQATRVQEVPAKCPVCATNFVAFGVVEVRYQGGMDPDFFLRAAPEPAENYGVWTCPQCYFSALPADFERNLPEDKRKLLLEKLPAFRQIRPEYMAEVPESQRKIPAWFKYKIALACYELRRDTLPNADAYLGDICLRGSWVTREFGNPIERSERVAKVFKTIMADFTRHHQKEMGSFDKPGMIYYKWYTSLADLLVKDLDSTEHVFTAEERPVAMLMAAGFLREAGELGPARRLLVQVAQGKDPKYEEERRIANRELELLIQEEEFQTQSVAYFQRALESGALKGTEREPLCVYLLGELSRRLGKPADARRFFEMAAAIKGVPDQLLAMVKEQQEQIK